MRVSGSHIIDDSGRILLLRGCNLGGGSKLPSVPAGDPSGVSFVGRPFPLEEAEEHFDNLKRSGLGLIRLVVTWEALEHSGPGVYDEAYLAYLRKLLLEAEKKGLSVIMDPHQDVWSRWTGGDGAPAWTLEKLGFDLERLDAVGAALTMERYAENHRGRAYPAMIWPVNYSLYGAATLFTLFFAGNAYAPDLTIEGEKVQDWLQERYIACFRHCYRRLKNCKAIIGWEAMNEPHPGFIGCRDLNGPANRVVALGAVPSPWEAMAAASGKPVKVPVYIPWLKNPVRTGRALINPRGLSLFKPGFSCPWKQAGVWAGEGEDMRLLKKDHFALYKGRPARFNDDFLKPFMSRFFDRMREAGRPAIFFVQGFPQGEPLSWSAADGEGAAHGFHCYDGPTLFTKTFRPWITADEKTGRVILGREKTAAFYSLRLKSLREWTRDNMGDMPCFLGEFGLPFDLNNRRAYRGKEDYRLHEEALSLYYDGIDENLLHAAIWNYTPGNTPGEGDGWNGEDLSIYLGGKGRAMGGWLRPYPIATAGVPLLVRWDRKRAFFRYRFRAVAAIEAPTEIYAPPEWLGSKPLIRVSGGLQGEYREEERRIFVYNQGFEGEAEISAAPGESGGSV
jgi:hypothetical protein